MNLIKYARGMNSRKCSNLYLFLVMLKNIETTPDCGLKISFSIEGYQSFSERWQIPGWGQEETLQTCCCSRQQGGQQAHI